MKNSLSVLALIAFLITVSANSHAQESFASAGVELGLPMYDWAEDVYSFSAGVSGAYEYGVSEEVGLNFTAGYQTLLIDSEASDIIASSSLVPIQLGVNYYADKSRTGLFVGLKVGAHLFSVKTEDQDLGADGILKGESNTETYISCAPQLGYFVTENISLALRYQLFFISEDKDVERESETGSYLGLRAAWNF